MPLGELGDEMGTRLTFCVYTLELFNFSPHKFIISTMGEIAEIYLLFCGI